MYCKVKSYACVRECVWRGDLLRKSARLQVIRILNFIRMRNVKKCYITYPEKCNKDVDIRECQEDDGQEGAESTVKDGRCDCSQRPLHSVAPRSIPQLDGEGAAAADTVVIPLLSTCRYRTGRVHKGVHNVGGKIH